MKSFFILLVIFSSSLIIAQNDDKAVVATVNNARILKSELDVYHQSRLMQFTNRNLTKKQSLQDLINREVALQKARKAGLDTEPAVRAQMENALYQAQIAKDLNEDFSKIKISDNEAQEQFNIF